MKDYFTSLIMSCFGILIMFFVPVIYHSSMMDTMSHILINDAVYDFVNDACSTGSFTYSQLEKMQETIGLTGNLYQVTVEHRSKKSQPSEKGGFTDYYESYFDNEIIPALFDSDGSYLDYTMKNGDYLRVSVSLKSDTTAMRLSRMMTGTTAPSTIYANYGLCVGNSRN